jgi:hypothetical protein
MNSFASANNESIEQLLDCSLFKYLIRCQLYSNHYNFSVKWVTDRLPSKPWPGYRTTQTTVYSVKWLVNYLKF